MSATGRVILNPWTSGEVALLRREAELGVEAIAEDLGRSVSSVKSQAHRLGVSLRPARPDATPSVCPSCGRAVEVPSSGACNACRVAGLARAHRERVATLEANRELDAARQAVHRAQGHIELR